MTDDNIINFPRIGFSRPSRGGGQSPPPPPTQPPTPGGSGRRSPMQIAAGVANPPAVRQGGGSPTTFRAGAPDDAGARLGALSMATVLAVAVAALRGTVTVLEDRRQRRMQRGLEMAPLRAARIKNQLAREQARHAAWEAAAKNAAEQKQARDKHALAMRGIGDKTAEQRAKDNGKAASKVPSSQEYGRKATGGGKGATGGAGTGNKGAGKKGAGAGAGTGRGNKTGTDKGQRGGGGRGPGSGSGSRNGAGGPAKKGTDAAGRGSGKRYDKSPKGGKSPSSSASSPAMERARGRQERRTAAQAAKLQNRAKDQDAARDRKNAAKDARRDAKDKARQPKVDAKQRRREDTAADKERRTTLPQALKDTMHKAADARLNNRRKNLDKPAAWRADRKAGPEKKNDRDKDPKTESKTGKDKVDADKPGKVDPTKNKPEDKADKGAPGRTKLWDAFKNDTKNTADDRWNKRGNHPGGVPPLWKNDKRRQKKQAKQEQPQHEKPKTEAGGDNHKSRWSRARDRVRNPNRGRGWMKDDCFGGTASDTTTGQGSNETGTASGGRRSPFDNVPQSGPYEMKVEREDRVGDQARTWKPGDGGGEQQALPADGQGALPAAPEPHTQRPGTGGPFPMPPAPMPSRTRKEPRMPSGPVGVYGGRRMDPQHATEITHDEAVDAGIKLKGDGLKTHQQSHVTAHRARKLRDTLRAFAEHLATQNNIIGPLFSGTMASLGESMDLLARMADEMQSRSLRAAENAEGASNEMEDAYRPITQATADAGLTTPSAPVHNET